jgi:hypothetical protein
MLILNLATFYAVRSISSLSPTVRGNLQWKLEINLEDILKYYGKYTFFVQKAIEAKGIGVEELCDCLLSFTGHVGDSKVAIIPSAMATGFNNATSTSEIFRILKKDCSSYFNYLIFECLLDCFEVARDQEALKYPEKFKEYVEKHSISELIELAPVLSEYTDDKLDLILVLDLDPSRKLKELLDIQKAVTKTLNLPPSALLIYGIKNCCVKVTFLISRAIAEKIFIGSEIFSDTQKEEFRRLSVLLLRCNGYTFEFSRSHQISQPEQDQSEGRLFPGTCFWCMQLSRKYCFLAQ